MELIIIKEKEEVIWISFLFELFQPSLLWDVFSGGLHGDVCVSNKDSLRIVLIRPSLVQKCSFYGFFLPLENTTCCLKLPWHDWRSLIDNLYDLRLELSRIICSGNFQLGTNCKSRSSGGSMTLFVAILTYFSDLSTPMYLRFRNLAIFGVWPLPAKGSKTRSPTLL